MSINKKLAALGALALVGAGVANAGALDLKGSDTLEVMIKSTISHQGILNLNYLGGGSGGGETAMKNGTQAIAPMSRFLGTSVCTSASPERAEGRVIGLDGIAIVQSRREGAPNECDTNGDGVCAEACPADPKKALYGCRDRQNADQKCVGLAFGTRAFTVREKNGLAGLQAPGAVPSGANLSYNVAQWQDVLALIWGGKHHEGTVDCNSDVRRSLADAWANITTAACQGQRCTTLSHAWRRDDISGTSDTFKSLVGITTFCNGTDLQDNDPIRRTCTPGEMVCEADGTLGLVLPIETPTNLTAAQLYKRTDCAGTGNFAVAPDGTRAPRDAANTFGCLATAAQNDGAGDGRRFNLVNRASNGAVLVDQRGRELRTAFYRIHSNDRTANLPADVVAGDYVACRRDTATLQIGCLVQADPCSLGFAALEATTASGVTNLKVKNNRPTIPNIQLLVTNPSNSSLYPLSRKLYLNTITGFENVVAEEDQLADALNSIATVNSEATAAGFVAMPASITSVPCEDFNEQTLCAAPGNSNACLNN